LERKDINVKKVTEAKMAASFSDCLAASKQQPIVVTRSGKSVAVLMAVDNVEQARKIASKPIRSLKSIFAEASAQIDRGEEIPEDQFWREVEVMRNEQSATKKRKSRVR
jgi:PHD/YefM family antitoxin component YafN of YafNO toxin-antitoxin module